MSVYKDKNGTWYVMTRCDDWQGQRKQKCKRGFKTKREAQDWERRFLLQQGGDLDMLFKDFYKLYEQDMKAHLKQNTWEHKACVIKSKILPYFGEKSMKDIQARDVLTWQNELLRHRDKNGKPYSETYLKNLHNQLSCKEDFIMIIRSKDKVNVNGKNKPVWVRDTDALTVTHNTTDAEPNVTAFSSDHIKYHLHYSAEYRPARLKKLVNDGTILSYLTDLDRSVAEAIERQVGKMLENDTEYLRAVAVGDLAKARGLENMDRLIARDPVYAAMVYM